ncbi:hypothetical protein [Candidatus Nitrosocosmicus franklandus]|nr:hypothetical protein [Candidatus Nitrosocosmicus franklandus]
MILPDDWCCLFTKYKTCFYVVTLCIPLLFISLTPFIFLQSVNGQILHESSTVVDNLQEISPENILDIRYSDLVNFTSKIEQIYGHLNASLLNKYTGNDSLAFAHASHPITEVYPFVAPQIAKTNQSLNQSLYSVLVNMPDVSRNSTIDEYFTTIQLANNILKEITNAVIPKNLQNDLLFNSFVVVNLLDLAGYEYSAAVTNGTIEAIFEYQDSKAFIKQAEKLMSIFNTDPETSTSSSELILLVNSLNALIDRVATPEEIYLSIDGIFSKMATMISTDRLTLLSKLGVTTD